MNDRYTYYDNGLGSYRILSNKKPWSLEYWDLVNIIGQLEDKIEEQNKIVQLATVTLKEDIQTKTGIYLKGDRFLFTQEEDGSLFLYKEDPMLGLILDEDEVYKYIDWE